MLKQFAGRNHLAEKTRCHSMHRPATTWVRQTQTKERMDESEPWHSLVLESGIYGLCNWYRPGSSDFSYISSFETEFSHHAQFVQKTLVAGDLNIHHQRWLTFSNDNTSNGEALWTICQKSSLIQIVKEPTRNQYLLDLCFTDFERARCEVLPPVSDHCAIFIAIDVPVPHQVNIQREVWDYRRARWTDLETCLSSLSWIPFTL